MTHFETNSETLSEHTEIAQSTRSKNKRKYRNEKKSKPFKEQEKEKSNQNFHLRRILSKTENQEIAFKAWDRGDNLLLHGLAGTGKSFISLYLGFREIMQYTNQYKQLLIVRSAVPSRDVGFLPGSIKDKTKIYEIPYQVICSDLFGRGDAYDILKQKKMVDFTTTSYIRGNTFTDTIVVVDEMQNMLGSELDTVITRLGDNCRLIFCGDFRQTDLQKESERWGVHSFMDVLKKMDGFEFVEFGEQDILRSSLVKQYIITKNRMGISFI